jgi:hypothetical protein
MEEARLPDHGQLFAFHERLLGLSLLRHLERCSRDRLHSSVRGGHGIIAYRPTTVLARAGDDFAFEGKIDDRAPAQNLLEQLL